jgi:hypothetical protein
MTANQGIVMRHIMRISFFAFALIAFANSSPAIDPSVFVNVLGVDIHGLKSRPGTFEQAIRLLGEARQIDTGDAAEYEGRIEYILNNRTQSIVFKIGECTEGYAVESANAKDKLKYSVLDPSIKSISVGGLRLGMNKKEVEKLFAGALSNGWNVEDYRKPSEGPRLTPPKAHEPNASLFTYQKTVSRDGGKFCDRIWIKLRFDSHAKLDLFEVTAGGCDDMPCEDR